MRGRFVFARNGLFGFFYKNILKKIFFLMDPEFVHDHFVFLGSFLGRLWITRITVAILFDYENPKLAQVISGIRFRNPIGLAAGFDKDARMTKILPSVGFGFGEIGSVTLFPYGGNAKPRLKRLIKSKSILVNYGLKNEGAKKIRERIRKNSTDIPIGISIARTNKPETAETEKGIGDYLGSYEIFKDAGDYVVMNLSCPNSYGGCCFMDGQILDRLLSRLEQMPKSKPVFLKLSPDVSTEILDEIIEAVRKRKVVDGFICSNLTKDRKNGKILEKNVPGFGGMSGKVVGSLSDDLIRYVYKKTAGKFVIIGCGGVFTAEDAYRKIKNGASLVQLITGMIFEGPQVVSEINRGLIELLERDGYDSISRAVGADVILETLEAGKKEEVLAKAN